MTDKRTGEKRVKKRVELLHEETIFKKFIFAIREARLRHELRNGQMSAELIRLSFVRGDSVAIVMHDPQADTVALTDQFRYPTYRPNDTLNNGWLMELPAGVVETGETPEDCVRREVREEIGYDVKSVQHLTTFFVSPGGTSERIMLYYASVSPKDKISRGGGVVSEGEDIQTLIVKVDEALKKIETGEIRDAKSIIGLQWLHIQRLTQ